MLALALALLQAPDTVRYAIAFPDRVHHEASVTVDFPATGGDTLEVWMSRSSPGRYAVHEFAKNVYRVHASDPAGGGFEVIRRTGAARCASAIPSSATGPTGPTPRSTRRTRT
jgi:hypothetical protein